MKQVKKFKEVIEEEKVVNSKRKNDSLYSYRFRLISDIIK